MNKWGPAYMQGPLCLDIFESFNLLVSPNHLLLG